MRRTRRAGPRGGWKASTPPSSRSGHLFGVAEVGVGLVLDDGGPALDGCGEEAADGVGLGVPVDLPDDRRGGVGALAGLPQLLDFPGLVGPLGVDALQPEGALDGDLAVAEGLVGEYLRLPGLLEVQEGVADAPGRRLVTARSSCCRDSFAGAGTTRSRR